MCRRSASSKLRHASSYGRPFWVVQPALNGSIQSSMPTHEKTPDGPVALGWKAGVNASHGERVRGAEGKETQ